MDAATFRALHPGEYQKRFLAEGIRSDGRLFTGCRKVSVSSGTISSAAGSALVRAGNTAVVCGVTAMVTFPAQRSPTHGVIEANVSLSALCGRGFHAHRPSEDALAISQFLNRTLARCVGAWGTSVIYVPQHIRRICVTVV